MDTHKLQSILPWFAFLILARLLPHPPNTTPIFPAVLALGYFLPKNKAITLGLLAFVISDIVLGFINHYPIFGLWSFFTYSGFIAALFLGATFLSSTSSLLRSFCALVTSTFSFWVWTNFGAWLTMVLYPKTLAGLGACFVAGIPFLSHSLLGNLGWGVIIFIPLFLCKKNSARLQLI